ncbi:MAG: class I SAM-dependent methyltransferase [Promethearchaeota archaeon]
MEKEKIQLDEHGETSLIPLYCRALETQRPNPIIKDDKAVEMINRFDYDFSQLKVPTGTYITTCMRAKQYDNYVQSFLSNNPNGIIVSLGCGLDSRFNRVDNGKVEWFDLDLPNVIDIKRKFFQETERYHFIASSIMDFEWMNPLSQLSSRFLFIAEGVFMYLHEEEVKTLVLKLQEMFPECELIFDAFSLATVKRVHRHPSLKKTGAGTFWGLKDGQELEKWNNGIEFLEEWFFDQSEGVKQLSLGYRAIFRLVSKIPVGRKAHWLLRYRLASP